MFRSARLVDSSNSPYHNVMNHFALALRILLVAILLCAAGPTDAKPKKPQVFARLNVTVSAKRGAARLPTPFTILPDEQRAAVYVPETGGVLLIHGEDVQHHFPIPTHSS